MYKLSYFLFICFTTLIFNSCSDESYKDVDIIGAWFGGGIMIDLDHYLPIPIIYNFQEDGTLLLNTPGSGSNTLKYKYSNDLLIINGDTLQNSGIRKDKTLSIKGSEWFQIRKVTTSDRLLDIKSIQNLLKRFNWVNQNELIQFNTEVNQLNELNIETKEVSQFCFRVDQVFGKFFLTKYGNHIDCKGNYQFLEQILSISEDEMRVLRWDNNEFKVIKFKSVKSTNFTKSNTFQVCNKYLLKRHLGHYYFSTKATYKGGLYAINKIISEQYQPPVEKESGIIRIRFVVNCVGKTGRFEILELDNDYKEIKFNSNIPQQLLSICRNLNEWCPGFVSENSVDSYKFLTFKIKDSEIVEIFP